MTGYQARKASAACSRNDARARAVEKFVSQSIDRRDEARLQGMRVDDEECATPYAPTAASRGARAPGRRSAATRNSIRGG